MNPPAVEGVEVSDRLFAKLLVGNRLVPVRYLETRVSLDGTPRVNITLADGNSFPNIGDSVFLIQEHETTKIVSRTNWVVTNRRVTRRFSGMEYSIEVAHRL